MKPETTYSMKLALTSLLILSLALSAQAASTSLSSLPVAASLSTNDDVIVNVTNAGTGTWTTKRATISKVAAAAAPLIPPPSLVTSNAAGLATTNILSAADISLANRRSAAFPRPMGFTFDSTTSQTIVSNTAAAMVANGIVGAGYTVAALNMGMFTNRINGALNVNASFSNGIPNLVSNLARVGCGFGFMLECNFDGSTNDSQSGSPTFTRGTAITADTAYADGYQIGAWGTRTFWLSVNDTVGTFPQSQLSYLTERLVSGMDAGVQSIGGSRPVFLRGALTYFYPKVPSLYNSVYSHPYGDLNTVTNGSAYVNALLWSYTSNAWVNGPSCARSINYVLHSAMSSWYNTNWLRVGMGLACMTEPQLFIANSEYSPLTAAEVGILTNADALAIFRDHLSVPLTLVSSNANQIVVTSPLANGDLALGLWNRLTAATTNFSVSIGSLPGIWSNSVYAWDVFGKTGTNAIGTLTATVNTNGFNLYRLSPVKGQTVTITDSAGNVSVYVNGMLSTYTPVPTLSVLTNLAIWLKADANTYASGTATNWPDSSGNLNHATNTANWPVYSNSVVNGKPAYHFATSTYLSTPYATANSNVTVFVVYKGLGSLGQTALVDKNAAGAGFGLLQSTTEYFKSITLTSTCLNNGLASAWYEAGYYRNGTNNSTWANSATNFCNQGNASAFDSTRVYIGSLAGGGSGFLTGDIAEVIYYTVALSDDAITSVRTYLRSKYGL